MKKGSTIYCILMLLIALLMAACSGGLSLPGIGEQAEAEAQATPTPTPERTVPVEIALVESGDIARIFSYTGDLEPRNEVKIVPGASGRIASILVEVGDEVKAGGPLAIIEKETYVYQFEQAEAALKVAQLNLSKMTLGSRPEEIAAAQAAVQMARAVLNDIATIDDNERTTAAANLAKAEADLRKAQTDYDKIAWAGDIGSRPEAIALQQATITYEDALADYNLQTNPSDAQLAPLQAQLAQAELQLALTLKPYREVDLESARATVQQAEAALKLAQHQLGETTIKAPFDGVVGELYIEEGSTVGPQVSVVRFLSNEVEVLINVEESRLGQIFKGQHAALRVPAFPGVDFPAVVTSVAPAADKDTHTFVIKITPLDEERRLRTGMSVDLSLLVEEKQNTLLAPLSAVTSIDGRPTVYVVKDDDTVEQRAVTTGLSDDERIEILSGLEAGETVVIAGQPNLTDGSKVEITTKL
jgi:HlyD family secretion protein